MGGYFAAFWDTCYGDVRFDYGALCGSGQASGLVWGTNPPYTLADFLAIYPKFFGSATVLTGTLTTGSQQVANLSNYVGLAAGQFVTGLGIPPGTLITAVAPYALALTASTALGSPVLTAYTVTGGSGPSIGLPVAGAGIPAGTTILGFDAQTITLSANATATSAGISVMSPAELTLGAAATGVGVVSLSAYQAPPLPTTAILLYLNLAQASIMQARYSESWTLAMALFIAHYCTLYLRSESGPNTTAAQIAVSGLEKGLTVSKSVGDVSTSMQHLGLEDWGSFSKTSYGVDLITLARGAGMGPIWVG